MVAPRLSMTVYGSGARPVEQHPAPQGKLPVGSPGRKRRCQRNQRDRAAGTESLPHGSTERLPPVTDVISDLIQQEGADPRVKDAQSTGKKSPVEVCAEHQC